MKKALLAVAVVALLAVSAQAGEIKAHEWPCEFVPVKLMQIPVIMDVGYWIFVDKQGDYKIELNQNSIHSYSGCVEIPVKTNTKIEFSVEINPTGKVPGEYSAAVESGSPMVSPGGKVKVCAYLNKADLSAQPGGTKDVDVALIILKVRPVA